MKKMLKKVVSIFMMTAMISTILPQDFVVKAAKNQAEEIDYSELNNEIYDNLEDYPVGNMEDTGEVYEDAVQVTNTQEYYEAVGESTPTTLSDETAPTASLPSAVDNSTNENAKYFPPIVSQIGGACTTYAYIYNMGTYTINQARDTDASQPENQLCPLFVYNMTRDDSSTGVGTSCANANKVIQNIGAPTADLAPISRNYSNYQYTWYPTEKIWTSATEHRIGEVVHIRDISHTGTPITSADDSDLDLLKTTLSNGKLVAFATYFNTFNYTVIPEDSASHAGEYAVDRCDYYMRNSNGQRYLGGHAMVIVGYDDTIWIDVNRDGKKQTGEFGAFKIANSHGKTYRNSGFVWVAYDALNKVSSVITDDDVERVNNAISEGTMTGSKIQNQYREDFFAYHNYLYTYAASSDASESSQCRLVTTLNTSDREDVTMNIVATEKSTGKKSSYRVEPFTITNWSTAFALDGSTNATDGTIVIDLNNVVSNISKDTINNYTWSVEIKDKDASSAPLTVKKLYITVDDVKSLTADVANDVLDGTFKKYDLSNELTVTDFSVSQESPISLVDSINLSAAVKGGSGNYQYRFGSILNGTEYEITNGYQSGATAGISFSHLISSGDGSGTAEAVGTHTLFVDVKDTETGVVVRKTIENYQVKPLEITSFTAEQVSPQSVGTTIKLNAEVEYEAPYRYNTYKFSVIKDGVETNLSPYVDVKYNVTWTPKEAGTYTLKYYVRDYLGQEATATMDYVIKNQKSIIYYQNDSWSQAYIHYKVADGEWTTAPGVKMEAASDQNGYQWKYEIAVNDTENVTVCFNNGSGSWDSKNGANYSVGAGMYGIKNGNINKLTAITTPTPTVAATATPTPTVVPTATPTSTVAPTATPVPTSIVEKNYSVIYYSNSSWSQAYIHFKTNNGSWTAVPGIKMEDNTSENGYTWKYVIDLNQADGATVCFNNGNGSWDSKNGANYSVGKGSYGISNGTIEELPEGISVNLSADQEVGGTFKKSVFTAQANNGTAPYTYQFAIVNAGETPSEYAYVKVAGNIYEYTPYGAREYSIYVKVTDANGKTAQTSMNYTVEGPKWGEFTATADNHKVGTVVKLEAEFLNYKPDSYNFYSFVIEKDGVKKEEYTGTTGYYVWTPTEEGIYTITAKFSAYTGAVYTTELTYEVKNGNTATIYYNSSWSNAYIHYCVAGESWSAVPGVAMTKTSEKSGYTYKYVIDLDDAESVTVCFNNGNGSWDSNNGNNYTITSGTYGVSNGNISEVK